jgi:NAD(P)-dependent dehydrogenase (short-subunit alcohol dehydrogenase family)
MRLKGKVVIITGGSSGIGRGCVEVFAREGAKIVFTGRDQDRMKKTGEVLASMGAEHLGLILDSGREEDNRILVEETIRKFGRIDILVNNAGISMRAMFSSLSLDVFRNVMDINFYGAVYATRFALPYILEAKGTIVAVSSINGHRATPARSAYSASKYAMEGFFESLRTEVMKQGVHVLVVSPGFTGTNIRRAALDKNGRAQGDSPRDEGKMMTSAQVAEAILRGIIRKKRDMVLTPMGKLVVFLNKWLPGWMDKMVYREMAKEKDSPFR